MNRRHKRNGATGHVDDGPLGVIALLAAIVAAFVAVAASVAS